MLLPPLPAVTFKVVVVPLVAPANEAPPATAVPSIVTPVAVVWNLGVL